MRKLALRGEKWTKVKTNIDSSIINCAMDVWILGFLGASFVIGGPVLQRNHFVLRNDKLQSI